MKLYAVIGAGGFGREVMPLAGAMLYRLLPQHSYELVFVDQHVKTPLLNDMKVMSFEEFFDYPASSKFFALAIADYKTRRNIAHQMAAQQIKPFSIYAENSMNLGHNQIDDGAIFCGYTTITANVKIGAFFQANIYSYIAHDCIIGNYVTFAPNVHCNGNVIIEDNVYVGTGTIIKQGTPDHPIIIGEGAVLGMGSVITKSVPPFQTVIGNPARPLIKTQSLTA